MTTPNTTANVKKKLQDLEEVEKDQEAEVAPVELAEEPVETTTPTAETASEPTEEKSVQPEDSAIVNDAAAAESIEKTSDSSTEEVSAEQVSVEPSAEEPATEPSVTALEEDQPPAAEESRTPQTDTETQKPATEIPLQAEPFVTTAVVEDHEPVAPAVSEPAPEPTVPEQGLSSEASTETPEPALADPAVVKAASTDMKDQIPTSGVYAADKPSHSKGGLLSKLWILVPIIVIVGLVAAALLFRDRIFSKLSSEEGTVVPVEASISPTPVTQIQPTSAPTPTVATIDRSKYKVRVLNGTEKAGLAGSLATELKAKGWTVSETGNAGDQSMEQTLVKYKKELDAVGKQLVDDLAAKYNAKSSATLTAADKADLEVTIGAK